LAEQGREQLNEAFNKLDELIERWNNRLTLDNLDLAKRYLKAELGVHVHLRYWVDAEAGRDSVDFCAIFQRKREFRREKGHALRRRELMELERGHAGVGFQDIGHGVPVDGALVRHADGHQELVFIRDVELVESPERIVLSLIRFGFLDEVHRSLRRSIYFGGVAGFKSIGALEDRKSVLFADRIALGTNHLANEQVEGRTNVVDAIPGDGAPEKRRLLGDFDSPDQIARMRLVITNGSVGLSLKEPLIPGLEITEVMFGPFDLCPNPGEIGFAGHDQYNGGVMASKRSKPRPVLLPARSGREAVRRLGVQRHQ
jgi:hypothetical protein